VFYTKYFAKKKYLTMIRYRTLG